jgi:hypothetical protein
MPGNELDKVATEDNVVFRTEGRRADIKVNKISGRKPEQDALEGPSNA